MGPAADQGLEFLTICLDPALVALLWPVLLRRLVRVAKEQRITSISDFISSRYGKSAPLGALVAGLVVIGLIPYIALQLQAVSQSSKLILDRETIFELFDPTLLVAVVLGLFGILFGARNPTGSCETLANPGRPSLALASRIHGSPTERADTRIIRPRRGTRRSVVHHAPGGHPQTGWTPVSLNALKACRRSPCPQRVATHFSPGRLRSASCRTLPPRTPHPSRARLDLRREIQPDREAGIPPDRELRSGSVGRGLRRHDRGGRSLVAVADFGDPGAR